MQLSPKESHMLITDLSEKYNLRMSIVPRSDGTLVIFKYENIGGQCDELKVGLKYETRLTESIHNTNKYFSTHYGELYNLCCEKVDKWMEYTKTPLYKAINEATKSE